MKKDDLEYPEADDREEREPSTPEEDFERWSKAQIGEGDFADVSEVDLPY